MGENLKIQREIQREAQKEALRIRKEVEQKEREEKEQEDGVKLAQMQNVLIKFRCTKCLGIGHLAANCPAPTSKRKLQSYVPMMVEDLHDRVMVKKAWDRLQKTMKMAK